MKTGFNKIKNIRPNFKGVQKSENKPLENISDKSTEMSSLDALNNYGKASFQINSSKIESPKLKELSSEEYEQKRKRFLKQLKTCPRI